MRKTRTADGVVWTDPTGRRWTSPHQHQPPAPQVRPLPELATPQPDALSPHALAELLADPDDDPIRHELRDPDVDPHEPDVDRLAEHLLDDDPWGLALHDPYRWTA